jgi:hypothetical protein
MNIRAAADSRVTTDSAWATEKWKQGNAAEKPATNCFAADIFLYRG